MNNGWTGGQYSVFRFIFGTYLLFHFVQLSGWGEEVFSNKGVLPDAAASPLIHLFPNILAVWDSPLFVTGLILAGEGLSVLFALGLFDRVAAIAIWYIWACLHGRNPFIANPGLPYVGWLLLAHACLPPRPYGSLAARGRPDPRGGWHMPPALFLAAWILMAIGYTYSGFKKIDPADPSPSWLNGTSLEQVLHNPLARPGFMRDLMLDMPSGLLKVATYGGLALELAFAPLALFRIFRPWVWLLGLLMHLQLMLLVDFIDLSLGMVMLHLFTFDPGWITPSPPTPLPQGERGEMIYYDGHCGLCHRWIRFVLAEDRTGLTFRFAPLGLDTFLSRVPEDKRAGLPDSVVVQKRSGELLVKSAAALYILARLGGIWRILSILTGIIPAPILNVLYDGVARIATASSANPPTSVR